jgi:dihydroorotate dehydrogenase
MTLGGVAYRRAVRPVLFRMGKGDPETAHHRTLAALRAVSRSSPALRALAAVRRRHPSPRTVFGIDFPSVVGLAAGMDKDGVALKAWPALGFGHVEVGTVTAHAQPGNPKPRLFRLPASEAIVNRMGFNNAGAAALAGRLAMTGPIGVPLGISLGKSKVTPVDDAVGDYLTSLRAVYPYADYIAVNVSSPNTPGLRSLQDRAPLDELLAALTTEAGSLAWSGRSGGRQPARPVPVLVKIAPDLTDHAIGDLLEVCVDRGIAGLIATNTTLARPGIAPGERTKAAETGGLSGRPLHPRSVEVVRFVTGHCDLPVIGVGGISSAADGLRMLDAGAALLQLYTGFIFGGPPLLTALNKAVAAR